MANSQFSEASKLLPTNIRGAIEQPKIREQILAIGEKAVRLQLEYELNLLADLINTGGNLNDSQIQFIAEALIEKFPLESIADFKLCFKRGAIGAFGPIQRLDGVTVGLWMESYLDEKYSVLEGLHKKAEIPQEDDTKKIEGKPVDAETAKKYADEAIKIIESVGKERKVYAMTDREKKFWGSKEQVSLEALGYKPDTDVDRNSMKRAISRIASQFYKNSASFDTSKFSMHMIGDYDIFAASQEDASYIHSEAHKSVFGK